MMPVEEILQLPSWDSEHQETVEDIIQDKTMNSFHEAITNEMRKAGVNLVAIVVWNDHLYDGHHRVQIAVELGLEEMLVTDNIHEADDWRLVKYEEKVSA
jgi:hypothetical protein